MEIKEPKFREGQKVIDKKGNVGTVIKFNSYHFEENEYRYYVSYDGETLIKTESFFKPYVEKPKTVWDLKSGDRCFLLMPEGTILPETWGEFTVQLEYRTFGNCFLTEEEAENELERRKIENEMLRLGGRRTFKKGEDNYYIFCDFSSQYDVRIYKEKDGSFGKGMIYFDSIKECMNAIDSIGVDRIKKYYFGVDE